MKKTIVCGSAAILMTGLTVSVFTTAEPRVDRAPAYISAAETLADGATVRAIASEPAYCLVEGAD